MSWKRRAVAALTVLTVAMAPGVAGAQTMAPPPALDGTATPAGQRVLEILEVVETWSPDSAAAFVQNVYAPSFLEAASLEAHLNFLASVRELAGSARLEAVESTAPTEAVAVVYAPVLDAWRSLSVQVEPEPPYRITRIRPLRRAPAPDSSAPRAVSASSLDGYARGLAAADLFSGGLLVARGDDVLLRSAYGEASREFGVANTPETRFILGSINKMFTAVAVLQLVERGLLGLDDPVAGHLPGVVADDVAERVTIRHLLTHTSGLGDFLFTRDMWSRNRADFRTVADYLPLLADDTLAFEPGADWRYSNTGFLVLGAIVERVAGQDYYAYVREHVLEPAGMVHTGWPELDRVPRNVASTYERVFDAGRPAMVNDRYHQVVKGTPAGGGFSTLDDMHRFARALQGGRLLSPETVTAMLSPRTEVGSDRYGFGAQIFGNGWVGHTGGGPGTADYFGFDPESGAVVVVLGNLRGESMEVAERGRRLTAASPAAGTGAEPR